MQWLRNPGESVERGEAVVLVHSEKIEYEVEAQSSGKLLRILVEPGTECAPGHLLGVIGENDEDVETFLKSYQPAAEEDVYSEGSRVPMVPVSSPKPDVPEIRASPRARKLAAEKEIDLAAVAAELPGKRIGEHDVLRFIERHGAECLAAPRVLKRVPLVGLRGEIATRMLASWQSAAMVALSMPVDFTASERLRQNSPAVGYQDIVMRAVALELRVDPRLNATIRDGNVEIYDSINIGFAVSLSEGVVVPVIREADRKTLAEISAERQALMEVARDGHLRIDQVKGGTFTLSSLGSYGVTVFTPILNPPQVGILGVGAVELAPTIVETKIELRPRLTLTLVFDHRALDGAPAAAFLRGVRERLQRAELD